MESPIRRSFYRLTTEQRRLSLLDAAADQLREGGIDALTITTLRQRAHVSRGHVYNHFESIDDLLAALYMREIDELDRRIDAAVRAAAGIEAKMRAALRAYFDFEQTRGAVFGQLQLRLMNRWFNLGPRDRLSGMFANWASALREDLGLPISAGSALVRALFAAAAMLVTASRYHELSREQAEDLALEISLAGLRSVTDDQRSRS